MISLGLNQYHLSSDVFSAILAGNGGLKRSNYGFDKVFKLQNHGFGSCNLLTGSYLCT